MIDVAILPIQNATHRAAGIVKMDSLGGAAAAIAGANGGHIPGAEDKLEVRYKQPKVKGNKGKW